MGRPKQTATPQRVAPSQGRLTTAPSRPETVAAITNPAWLDRVLGPQPGAHAPVVAASPETSPQTLPQTLPQTSPITRFEYGPAAFACTADEPQFCEDRGAVPAQPLAEYYLLYAALPTDDIATLHAAASRREALRRDLPVPADAPIEAMTGVWATLADLLDPDTDFVGRDEMLNQFEPAFDSQVEAEVQAAVAAVARNEALRLYLQDLNSRAVFIELADPEALSDEPSRLRFSVDGVELLDSHGGLPVESLDAIAPVPLRAVAWDAGQSAAQRALAAEFERTGNQAVLEAFDMPKEIDAHPGGFAYNDVKTVTDMLAAYLVRVRVLRQTLAADNADLAGRLDSVDINGSNATQALRTSLNGLQNWQQSKMPDTTAGEMWTEMKDETEDAMSRNIDKGGVHYLKLVPNGLEWITETIYDTCGNIVTGGYMGREERNAKRFRQGAISYDTYDDNQWWNLGASMVTALVTLLTAGWGSRLGAALGFEASTVGGMAAAGAAEGFVSGATTALAGDIYNLVVSQAAGNPGVAAYHSAAIVGPGGWIFSGMEGAVTGYGMTGMMGRFGPKEPASATQTAADEGAPPANAAPDNLPPDAVLPQGPTPLVLEPAPFSMLDPPGPMAPPPSLPEPVMTMPGTVKPTAPDIAPDIAPAIAPDAAPNIAPGAPPRLSPVLDASGQPYGAADYLASGAPAARPTLYDASGARVMPPGAPVPEVTLYGPTQQVVVGPQPSPARPVVLDAAGNPVFDAGNVFVGYEPTLRVSGTPGYERLPGNATAARPGLARSWQEYEAQAAERRVAATGPSETQTEIPLMRPTQFSGRPDPQQSVIPDYRAIGRDVYGDAKMRNWSSPNPRFRASNAADLAGSMERLYIASMTEGMVNPAALSARFEIVTARPIPAATHRLAVRTAARWLRDAGFSAAHISDFLGRTQFIYMRMNRP